MASPRLPNYLRAHRKRLALTQEELAYLLGAENGTKVCRYEAFIREPKLHTILAYEAVYQKPASELFAGKFHKIEQEMATRAEELLSQLAGCKPTSRNEHKRKVLVTLIAALKSAKSK